MVGPIPPCHHDIDSDVDELCRLVVRSSLAVFTPRCVGYGKEGGLPIIESLRP